MQGGNGVAAGQRGKGLVCQIKVMLNGTGPPIWRRFLVLSDITLRNLHQVLQVVMGWTNSHLYQFAVRGRRYGEPYPELGMKNSKATKLRPVTGDHLDAVVSCPSTEMNRLRGQRLSLLLRARNARLFSYWFE